MRTLLKAVNLLHEPANQAYRQKAGVKAIPCPISILIKRANARTDCVTGNRRDFINHNLQEVL